MTIIQVIQGKMQASCISPDHISSTTATTKQFECFGIGYKFLEASPICLFAIKANLT